MAERTEEHEALIKEAKKIGIKSPHLFGIEALTNKIKKVSDGDDTGKEMPVETTSPDVNIKEGDGWLYHETEQPRVFKDGDEVPEGWNIDNRKLWKCLYSGKFVNVNS